MAINTAPLREYLRIHDEQKNVEDNTKSVRWPNVWSNWLGLLHKSISGWTETLTSSVTFDFGAISAGSELTTTLTIAGARTGDMVIVQCSQVNGLGVDGAVTSDDTVTIRRFNYSTGSVNPSSDTFRVIVFRQ